ncbi:hypothetical protein E2562_016887 [Oryza meyeriana var. granulata]|uniref:Uncharacterized protein n=1 Tax=Oryza meyeriana var. granulata TaxID=110450 RepID=A0A6G1BX65_9ORYZ|nr:hypothetical protein E2562_016887 [Oryza meyeriana var. granulata]
MGGSGHSGLGSVGDGLVRGGDKRERQRGGCSNLGSGEDGCGKDGSTTLGLASGGDGGLGSIGSCHGRDGSTAPGHECGSDDASSIYKY